MVQHPDGAQSKLAVGVFGEKDTTGFRRFHDANTDSGSSGSAITDVNHNVKALHQAGDVAHVNSGEAGNPETNQAIPIDLIMKDIAASAPGALLS